MMSELKFTPGPWQKLGSAEDDECRVRQTASVRESDGFIVEKTICTNVRSDADAKLIAAAPGLIEALREGRRAIGDHYAPGDCYATGPLTGDDIRDLVECPACSFIAMYESVMAKATA